jgi:hypothetical protein
MPSLYCPDCGNPNRYVGAKPPKCAECDYAFAVSNPKPPTKRKKEMVMPKIKAKIQSAPEVEDEEDEEDDGYDTRRRRISKAEVMEEYKQWNLRDEVIGGNDPRRVSFKSQVGNAPRRPDTRTASQETIERQRQSYFPPDKVHEIGDGA